MVVGDGQRVSSICRLGGRRECMRGERGMEGRVEGGRERLDVGL
jgi:hypothetical protein